MCNVSLRITTLHKDQSLFVFIFALASWLRWWLKCSIEMRDISRIINTVFLETYYSSNLSLCLSLSSSILRKVFILLWTKIKSFHWDFWEICKARIYTSSGRITSLRYMRKYGEVLMDRLGDTQLALNAFTKELCQFLCSEKTIFLIIHIKFLLVDSTKPFPYS